MSGENIKYLIPVKKGEVRNPNGRPKGGMNAKTIIKRYLESKEPVLDKDGKPTGKKLPVLHLMTMALIKKAREGDIAAYNALVDRVEGKATQRVESTGADGGPIQTENYHRHEVVFRKMNNNDNRLTEDETPQNPIPIDQPQIDDAST